MNSNVNKSDRQTQILAILRGIAKRYPALVEWLVGGITVNKAALVKAANDDLEAMLACEEAKATLRLKVAAAKASRAALDPQFKLLKALIFAQFGTGAAAAEALADFGLTPRKVSAKSAAAKQRAAERAKATRAARHTMGPKQKAAIKGAVVPVAAPLPVPLPSPSGNGGKPM